MFHILTVSCKRSEDQNVEKNQKFSRFSPGVPGSYHHCWHPPPAQHQEFSNSEVVVGEGGCISQTIPTTNGWTAKKEPLFFGSPFSQSPFKNLQNHSAHKKKNNRPTKLTKQAPLDLQVTHRGFLPQVTQHPMPVPKPPNISSAPIEKNINLSEPSKPRIGRPKKIKNPGESFPHFQVKS